MNDDTNIREGGDDSGMNGAERHIHDIQQTRLADVWDKNLDVTCDLIEQEHIDRALDHRIASRPHRVIHEVPRRNTNNGYVYDV